MTRVGVAEKLRGRDDTIFTIISSLGRKTAERIGAGHGGATGATVNQRRASSMQEESLLEVIGVRIGKPHLSSSSRKVPNAAKKIVFDGSFMARRTKAVDQV